MGMGKPPLVDGREAMMQTASHLSRKQLQIHSSDDMPSNLGIIIINVKFVIEGQTAEIGKHFE